MKNFRDIEQLSAYLDGELGKAESKRLETRLANEPQLVSVLSDIRSARGILRKLPKRKAPRNFTLTRQMVGIKPPLPRSYGFVRFSTAFATILLVVSFAFNFLSLGMGSGAASEASAPQYGGGYGGGGGDDIARPQSGGGSDSEVQPGIGGGCAEPCDGAQVEAPAAAEESAASDLAPEATITTQLLPTPDDNAEQVTAASEGEDQLSNKAGVDDVAETPQEPSVPDKSGFAFGWQFILLGIIVLGLAIMFVMRQSALRKWR